RPPASSLPSFRSCSPPPPPPSALSLHDALPISLNTITSAVMVQITTVSMNGSRRATIPSRTGWSVRAAECAMAAEPAPASFEKRSEEHTSELQSRENLVCRLLLEKKKPNQSNPH